MPSAMILDIASDYPTIVPRYPELRDKVAIVTGSGRGIGQGIAVRLAREGMRVVITGRTAQEVETTAQALRQAGAQAWPIPADLSRDEGMEALVAGTLSAFGTVDLLVNNAAMLQREHVFDVTVALLEAHLATNIRSPYLLSHRCAQIMRDHGHGGSIINISSIGGLRAHWRGLPYDVTKGALHSLTQAMAVELASYGIRVNCIAPGPIYVGRPFPVGDPRLDTWAGRVPAERLGHPLDIGNVAAFLASHDASYIVGQVIAVDGGVIAQLSPKESPV